MEYPTVTTFISAQLLNLTPMRSIRDILMFHVPEKEKNCRSHWKLRLQDQINLKTSDERDIIYVIKQTNSKGLSLIKNSN